MNANHRMQQTYMDGVLTEFFRSETPKTWPACPETKSSPATVSVQSASSLARWWRRSARHFTVAAAIALLLGGYWLLSNQFPDEQPNGPLPGPNTAFLPLETKNGNRAVMEKRALPNGGWEMRVHPLQNQPFPGNLPNQP